MSSGIGEPSSGAGQGAWLTFSTLARSRVPGAREMLLGGLDEPDGGVQLAAARAILRHARRDGAPHLINAFHKLTNDARDEIVRNVDDLTFALRDTLAAALAEARANAVEIVRHAGRVKLAYLLVQALGDAEESVRTPALEALRKLAEDCHRQIERARSGEIEVSRAELETRTFALIDPILGLLGDLSRPQGDEVLLLAMGLDVRTDEMLFAILGSKQDPRAERLRRVLLNSSSPQAVSFLLDCLRDARVAARAATILAQRRDFPFVRGLLLNRRFFGDYRVRDGLKHVKSADFLRSRREPPTPETPGEPRKDVFSNSLLALRAIHFLMLTGTPAEEKAAFLRGVAGVERGMFVTGLAESVLKALEERRTDEEIAAALAHLENLMGIPPVHAAARAGAATLEMPELELPWAHPETESLPHDAFAQFFNTFDRLDEATRLLAVQALKRLDSAHLEHVQRELSSLDAERRLKAVKMVLMFQRAQHAAEALLKLAGDPDRHVRATVVKTLGILEDEPAIRVLLEAVTDLDRRVVANSVEAIEAVGREELLGLVRIFADHPNNRIRANAVKALWNLGDSGTGKRIDDMLSSDDEMMRLSATWLLGEIDRPHRIEMLRRAAESDPSERVRAKALDILGEGG